MKPIVNTILLGFVLISCNNDNEPESTLNMMATGKWDLNGIITDYTDSAGHTSIINVFDLPQCPECIKDDEIEIFSNGKYEISLGELRCNKNTNIFKFPHEGVWLFSDDEQQITLNPDTTDSTTMDINVLTESELRMTYYDTIPQLLFKNDSGIHAITILYLH